MLLFDTTPLWDYIDNISGRADHICAAINWDKLSSDKKNFLTEAKSALDSKIISAHFHAESRGLVGHYVDIEGNITMLRHALDSFLSIVRQIFSYNDVQGTELFEVLYNKEV